MSDSPRLREYLIKKENDLNKALLFLAETNRYAWHDSSEEIDDYETIRFIDQQINPAYLRLIEAVFYPLTHLPALFSRIDRGKGTDGLDIFNTVEEIKKTDFWDLADLYRNTVRNGIAHGGITYVEKQIRYQDKANEEVLTDRGILRLVDDLVDACNGMALALKLFIFSHFNDGYTIPKQMLLEQLQAETDTPWWHIIGCMPSRFASRNQLIIYARPNSRDYLKVAYSTFLSGILAERFAPGYDRYFFSFRSPKALPGWAAFDGKRLREIRNKGSKTLTDYQGALENNLIFYTPKIRLPRVFGKLDTLSHVFRLQIPLALADMRERMGHPNVRARMSSLHRAGWGAVLKGSVYIVPTQGVISQELLRNNCRRIISTSLSGARRDCPLTSIVRYLPLRYARIAVFAKNYRRRRLLDFGLGTDLVATIQIQLLSKIRSPDIYGSQVEIRGRYRIAWNSKWLAINKG